MTDEIKAIMFDYGGVITLGEGPKAISRELEKEYSLAEGVVFPAFRKFYREAKVGKMKDELFWKNFLNESGISFGEKEKVKNIFLESQLIRVDKKMLDCIMNLKKDYFTIMLTNNIEFWFEHDKKKNDLDDYFDCIFTSYGMKMKKPDTEIFQSLMNNFSFKPSEYIFIDDQLANVNAAREVGMNANQFKDFEQLKNDLKKYGIIAD